MSEVATNGAGGVGRSRDGRLVGPGEWAIDLSGVTKVYRGKIRALDGVSMQVRRGEVFGLLGPNGAGKSTLVKILMTVISATRCEGMVLGRRVGEKGTLERVGYLPEHHRFPGYLTGAQVLDFYGAMSKAPRRARRARTGELLELVGMRDWARTPVGRYSKGMRQRIGIAQALMNDPDLVLLDEPTDGVDPVGRRDIRAIVQSLRERGKTVFLNSHLLSELEMVCDRVAIMVQGRVTRQGTLDELTRGQARYEVEIEAEGDDGAPVFGRALPGLLTEGAFTPMHDSEMPARALEAGEPPTDPGPARRAGMLGHLATGERVEVERATVRIGTTSAERVQPVIDSLRARGVVVRSVRMLRPSLEDLFMQAVTDASSGETLRPGARRGKKGRQG